MCNNTKLKLVGISLIAAITLTVIISMALLTGLGALEAGIDIAIVTLGVNGIVSVLKSDMGAKNGN